MARLSVTVPPAFIIPIDTCNEYLSQSRVKIDNEVVVDCVKAVHELELLTRKSFGGGMGKTPLLLSVRSSPAVHIPGVTILNLGMNTRIAEALVQDGKNVRWVFNLFRSFLHSFGTVVLGVQSVCYTYVLERACRERGVKHESELTEADLIGVVNEFKALTPVPDDPWEQLNLAVEGIFNWWRSPNTTAYRDLHKIATHMGTAVLVQSMVYPDLDSHSGYAAPITRNVTSGARELSGDFYSYCAVRHETGDMRHATYRPASCTLLPALSHVTPHPVHSVLCSLPTLHIHKPYPP
jgi:pyruvate,orthophosphate dikinase